MLLRLDISCCLDDENSSRTFYTHAYENYAKLRAYLHVRNADKHVERYMRTNIIKCQ